MDVQRPPEELSSVTDSFAGLAERLRAACAAEMSAEQFREELLRSEVELVGALYGAAWHVSPTTGKMDAEEIAVAVGPEAVGLWRIPLCDLAIRVLREGAYGVQEIGEPADRMLSGSRYLAMGIPVPGPEGPVCAVTMAVREEQGMWHGRGAACAQVLANFSLLHAVSHSQQTYQRYYEDISRVWDLVGSVMAYDQADKMAQVLANGARSAFGVMRVTVGLHRRGHLKVAAISDEDTFDKRGNTVRALEAAHEEALADGQPVSYILRGVEGATEDSEQEEDADGTDAVPDEVVTFPAHADVAADSSFGGEIYSVPLRAGDEVVGVWTMECDADKPLGAQEKRLVQIASGQVGPLLGMVLRRARPVWRKASDRARKVSDYVLSVEHPYRRVVAILIVAAVGILGFGQMRLRLRGKCVLEPTIKTTYCAPFETTLESAPRLPGDTVKKGDTLVVLDHDELNIKLRQARSEQIGVEKESAYYLTEGKRVEREIAKAKYDTLTAQIELLERHKELAVIRADNDGILVAGDLRKLIGSRVKMGDPLVEVAPLDRMTLVVELAQEDISYAKVGQKGVFTTKDRPDLRIPFEVKRIRPAAEVRSESNVFVAEARVENADGGLRPGMEGVAKIDVGKSNVAWVLSRRLVNWVRMRVWW